MRSIFIIFLFVVHALTANSQTKLDKALGQFFEQIRRAAHAKDSALLQSFTIDFIVRKPKINLGEGIVKGILEERPSGDFAYTESALRRLSRHYTKQFKAVSAEEFAQIAKEFHFGEHPQLQQLQATDVFRLDIAPTKVVVLRLNGVYKLFYWRDLPQLR